MGGANHAKIMPDGRLAKDVCEEMLKAGCDVYKIAAVTGLNPHTVYQYRSKLSSDGDILDPQIPYVSKKETRPEWADEWDTTVNLIRRAIGLPPFPQKGNEPQNPRQIYKAGSKKQAAYEMALAGADAKQISLRLNMRIESIYSYISEFRARDLI